MAGKKEENFTEQFFDQLSESVQMVVDITSRLDERVKMLTADKQKIERQIVDLINLQQQAISRLAVLESKDPSTDLKSLHDELNDLNKKVAILDNGTCNDDIDDLYSKANDISLKVENLTSKMENQIENLVTKIGHQDNRWSRLFDSTWKLLLTIIAAYILYILGIKS